MLFRPFIFFFLLSTWLGGPALLCQNQELHKWLLDASSEEVEAQWPMIQDSLGTLQNRIQADRLSKNLQILEAKKANFRSSDSKNWLVYWQAQLSFLNQKPAEAIKRLDGLVELCVKEEVRHQICGAAYQARADIKARIFLDFNEAIASYRASIDYYLNLGDTIRYLNVANTLAQLYGEHQFFDLADKERQQIFDFGERLAQYDLLIVSHLAACLDDLYKGDSVAVLEHLEKVESYLELTGEQPRYEYFFHRFFLAHYFYTRQADKALFHYQRIEELSPIINKSQRYHDHLLRDKATWLSLSGQSNKAISIGKQQLTKAKEEGRKHDIIVLLEIMEYAASQQGDWALAFKLTKEREVQKDSIVKAAHLTQSIYYNDLYEQEQAIAQQAQMYEIEWGYKIRLRLLLIGILVLLLATTAFYYYRNAQHSNQERKLQQKFSQDLIQVRSNEQSRISRDLHDRIGQELALLKQFFLRKQNNDAATINHIDNILKDLRAISHELHDPGPEQIGFNLSVIQLIQRFDQHTDIFWNADLPKAPPPLAIEAQAQLFSILREAFQNVVRHAKARAVSVVGKWDEQNFELYIQDNGKGIVADTNSGIGIRGMRERAEIAKLKIKITSQKDQGTKIEIKN